MATDDGRGRLAAASMRLKLKYADVETFVQKYAVNISRGGIFIATKTPKAVGTPIKFEFLLADAASTAVIRGEGTVQWVREPDAAAPQKACGMGVKFTRLDAESQAVVDRALAWRAAHGEGSHVGPLPQRPEPSQAAPLPVAAPPSPVAPPKPIAVAPPPTPVAIAPPPTPVQPSPVAVAPPPPAPVVVAPVAAAPPPPSLPPRQRRVIEMPAASADVQLDGSGNLDAMAATWGISDEKIRHTLSQSRGRVADVAAELAALAQPGAPVAVDKAEALREIAALLKR